MGLLLGGPRHGYELKRLLEKDLSPLFSVSSAPIYYTLRKLEEEGLVVKWTEVKGRKLRFLLRKQAEELRGDSSRRREAIIAAHNLRGVEAEIEFVKDLMEEFREEATEREAHDRR